MWQYNNTDELQHWGIKGMRWGVRRYQNKDGSLTPAGKKRYDDDNDSDYDRESYERERTARIKSKILDSDDAATIYNNRDLFTTNELQEAYRRLNTEKLIRDLVPREVSKTEKFIKNTTKWTGDIANMLGQGVNLYNNVQKVNNLIKGDQKKDGGNDTANAGNGKKKKNKGNNSDGGSENIKDAVDTAKQVFSKMDKNPVTDVAKGVISKYASMNTSAGKTSPAIKKATGGILSKYSSMNVSSIDASARDSGSAFVKNILDDSDYKLTDKDKK